MGYRKRTKILCTLGPATDSPATLERMIHVGMDLARINMSHGDHAAHTARMALVHTTAKRTKRPVGILVDLQGPKLRLGNLEPGGVMLKRGQVVQLGGPAPKGSVTWLPTPFRHLARELHAGDAILLDDGALELRMEKAEKTGVLARVITGGQVSSHKGINIPGRALSVPAFTAKDKADLAFALQHDADFVAMSFVRSAADIKAVRRAMKREGTVRPIVAKIEKPQALDDIDNIIDVADGIMVARGDLGVELSVERVPGAQKTIIHKCALADKWVIVATQMLESMIEHPSPTRAEASDVANAVYDGADCVMLSAETAVGSYPVRVVRTMADICAAAETSSSPGWSVPGASTLARRRRRREDRRTISHAIVEAALVLLEGSDATALWVFTQSGRTAQLVSKMRPAKPVHAFSPREASLRFISGLWGIHPMGIPMVKTTDEMVSAGEQTARRHRWVRQGDRVVVLAGQAPTVGATDIIKVHVVR